MPGMKQKVTEMVFGMKLSDGGEIDRRRKKHSPLMPFILLFSIGILFFLYICFLDSFPTLSCALFFSTSHLFRFKYTVLENISPAFFICRSV